MINPINLIQVIGMARRNPQQTTMELVQQMFNGGKINQQQYNMLMNSIQNGVNPNQIIQQLMSSGMVSQQDYETARQNSRNFR